MMRRIGGIGIKRRGYITVSALIICLTVAVSCQNYTEMDRIEDYPQFLAGLPALWTPETDADGLDAARPDVPFIAGFSLLTPFGFSAANPFTGNYAYVRYGETPLLLSRDGKLYTAPEALSEETIVSDKFIFEQDGLLGVKSVFGEWLVNPAYYEILIRGDRIAARDRLLRWDVYENGKVLHAKLPGELALYADDIFLYDGKLCDADLEPLTAFGYEVVKESHGGMRMITDGNMRYGYASDDSKTLLEPIYQEVWPFNDQGYACVVDDAGKYNIIDLSGEIVYAEQNGRSPVSFDGMYITFMRNGSFDIADKDFSPLTDERFAGLRDWRVYGGDLLIYDAGDGEQRFYSLKNRAFTDGTYASITPVGDYFVTKTGSGAFALYDAALHAVVGASADLVFDGEILLVQQAGTYWIYKIR